MSQNGDFSKSMINYGLDDGRQSMVSNKNDEFKKINKILTKNLNEVKDTLKNADA
jgi:hypothetical protein